MANNFNDFNYLEINLFDLKGIIDDECDKLKIIDINWSENSFNGMLKKIINNYKLKSFEKKFRILKHNDKNLIFNIIDNKYHVNKQSYVSHIISDKNILIKYQKENIPPVNFPSTNNIHDTFFINKIIFKITNRIYINFELKKKIIDNKSEIFRRVYINLNNDKINVDNNNINEKLEECVNYFT